MGSSTQKTVLSKEWHLSCFPSHHKHLQWDPNPVRNGDELLPAFVTHQSTASFFCDRCPLNGAIWTANKTEGGSESDRKTNKIHSDARERRLNDVLSGVAEKDEI